MDADELFISITSLICEPARAKMLWNLLDGRAYTASELAIVADISATSASNHLSKLLDADVLKVEKQGRHRYYSFSSTEVAYAIEAMAQLAKINSKPIPGENHIPVGIKYCRTCYDHLAGFVGVKIVESMEQKGYLRKKGTGFLVTQDGWNWLAHFKIYEHNYKTYRRPLTRQCLDWSERRPHMAGQLGADLLQAMLERKWFKKVEFTRELIMTIKGRKELYKLLGVVFQ